MNGESKTSIIKAITSPLGFFALSLLIVEGFLGIALLSSGLNQDQKFIGMCIGGLLFVIVVTIVSLLVAFKPKNLTFGEESHLKEEGKYYPPYGEKGDTISESDLETEPKGQVILSPKKKSKK